MKSKDELLPVSRLGKKKKKPYCCCFFCCQVKCATVTSSSCPPRAAPASGAPGGRVGRQLPHQWTGAVVRAAAAAHTGLVHRCRSVSAEMRSLLSSSSVSTSSAATLSTPARPRRAGRLRKSSRSAGMPRTRPLASTETGWMRCWSRRSDQAMLATE
uniref:Uncharacterized protein n=1 Tax=Oryza brachyantha TaxID=4533 RepID=J3LBV5_ORYBR